MGNLTANIYEAMRSNPKPHETCGELYEAVREQYGIGIRAFQLRFAKETGNSYAKNREVTAKEKTAMLTAYPKKEILKRTSQVRNKAGESPALKAAPGYLSKLAKIDFDTIIVRVLLGSGVVGHAFLIWHEMGYLWGNAGAIAGAVVFIIIVSAVVLMRKSAKTETSDNLLWFVWLLDAAAWFVHKSALYHQGTAAYGAGITEFGTGCLAAIVCLCAMALLYFYKETGKK